jgi:hypothetical protein
MFFFSPEQIPVLHGAGNFLQDPNLEVMGPDPKPGLNLSKQINNLIITNALINIFFKWHEIAFKNSEFVNITGRSRNFLLINLDPDPDPNSEENKGPRSE